MKKKKKKSKKNDGKPSSPKAAASVSSNAAVQPALKKNGGKKFDDLDASKKAAAEPPKETSPADPLPQQPASAEPEPHDKAPRTDRSEPSASDASSEPSVSSSRVKLEPKPLKMDPDKDAPRWKREKIEEYREVSLNELSKHARSITLDPRLDKQRPRWLQKTMDHVIHYMAVPKKKTLREKIWHHRLRVPVLYALAGIALALLANLYDAHRIYRMQGDLDYTPPPIVRPPLTADEEGDTLVMVREKHNQEAYRIENIRNILEREWPNEYVAKLQQMQDALRDKGDFMAWMDVKRELERFSSEQTLQERHIVKSPEELRALQLDYHEIADRYEADMQAALAKLHGNTLRQLEALLKTKKAQGAQEETLRAIAVEIEFMRNNPPAEPVREPAPASAPGTEDDEPGAAEDKADNASAPDA